MMLSRWFWSSAVIAIMVLFADSAKGQEMKAIGDEERAEPVSRLYACRALTNPTERLSCFDGAVSFLQEAEARKDVVIADRAQVREARRGLFGFSLPKIGLFSAGRENEEEIHEVEDQLATFGYTSTDKLIFSTVSGARWIQTDSVPVLGTPKVGDTVRIEQAMLGSYRAKIDGRRAIRVKRVD